jgi:glyoxylase-like metal-dependent hydrolase (beta-lactamase superfamily II)
MIPQLQMGDLEIHFLSDGEFKLDGGAMFGIVPKPLWVKERPADDRNRMVLSCNTPLIRIGKENILIDCGLGRKWNPKQRDIYDIAPQNTLIDQLAEIGLKPKDITILIHTHLHLDHCGWNTQFNAKGEAEPVFVNAKHVVERRELHIARAPNEIQRGTYLIDNIAPIDAEKSWEIFDDEHTVAPAISLFRTGGHTAGHVGVRIDAGGQHAMFIGEMLPTTSHRVLPWIMAYDLYPMETLEQKRKLFKECLQNNTLVLMNHDAMAFGIRLNLGANDKVETRIEIPRENGLLGVK